MQLPTTQSDAASETIHKIRKQFNEALERLGEQLAELARALETLKKDRQRLEEAAFHLFEAAGISSGPDTVRAWPAGIFASVRKLASATYAAQVLEIFVEQAAKMNARSVVFDVRGGAAWASAASGFQPEVPADELRTLAVSLNQDGPFRRVIEASEPVETDYAGLENYGNVLAKLNPSAKARILLAPVRSAGSVAAILYADFGGTWDPRVIDALKVLAEFAGAHMDRLMVLSAGPAAAGTTHAKAEKDLSPVAPSAERRCEVEVSQPESDVAAEAPTNELPHPEADVANENPADEAPEVIPVGTFVPSQEEAALPVVSEAAEPPGSFQPSVEAPAIADCPEEEAKIHRDAKRFSKLLVSEIELYNRSSVEEGRRNKDLYQRLKKDIDRSRETYEKRFGRTVAKQADYFHEELVRTLAQNDPALLGPDYPGSMA